MGEVKAIALATVDPWALAWRALNDDGNAQRLVARAAGRLVHVREWGWLAYDTRRWSAEDGQRLANLMAIDVARGIRDELEALSERADKDLPDWCTPDMRTERIPKLAKHAETSGNAAKTKAMLDQASNLDDFHRRSEVFDVDTLTINARNRTLRFGREDEGKVWMRDAPHDPEDHLTRVTASDWEPGVRNRAWEDHVEAVLPSEPVRHFFHKVMGYCATGLTIEQIFILLQGNGGDGKSTAMNVIRKTLGDYAVSGKVETFLEGGERGAGDATPELVRFVGDTRLISTQEPKKKRALDEARVKQFTGGSPVPYRANYGDEAEFEPRGKVVMEVNSRPRISGADDGIWRRIVIILFTRQFKGKAEIKGMADRLIASEGGMPGVLNWLLDGVRAYLEEGLEPPPEVVEAIEEYRRSANPFSEWLASRVDRSDPLALTLASDLWNDYKEWCVAEGVDERIMGTSTSFGRELGDKQIMLGPRHRSGRKQRRGAKLRPKDELYPEGDGAPEERGGGGPIGPQDDVPFG